MSLRILFIFLNFSFPNLPQFGFSSVILFRLSGLELLYSFPFTVCSCSLRFLQGIYSFNDLYHIHEVYFKVFFLCFNYVAILRAYVVGLLYSSGDILSWLLLILFLYFHLGIWVWEDCNSRYLILSLLGECLFLDFCCPLCS